MFFVEKLGMELDAVDAPALFLHRLDLARLVRRVRAEAIRHFFHFVTVVVQDSDLRR